MSNVQLPGTPSISPNRPLTGGPAPAVAPPAPAPGMQADALATSTVPKDPAMLANLAIMSLDLASPDPAKVKAALAAIEGTFGPAYRADVAAAVAAQVRPGVSPQVAAELGQSLVRLQASTAMPQLQAAAAADPALAAALAPAQQALAGMALGSGNAPGPAVAPNLLAPQQQAVAPQGVAPQGQPTAAVPPIPVAPQPTGITQAQIEDLARRLGDRTDGPSAALQVARLPSDQAAAVMRVALADPNTTAFLWGDKAVNVVVRAMSAKLPEPGAIEIMRRVVAIPKAGNGLELDEARARAAAGLLQFGNPQQDIPGLMRLLVGEHALGQGYGKILIKAIASKPGFMDHQTVVRSMATLLNDTNIYDIRMAAAFALTRSKHPWAAEAVGTSVVLRDPAEPSHYKRFLLEYLRDNTRGPLPASVKAVLAEVAKHPDAQVADLAKALARR